MFIFEPLKLLALVFVTSIIPGAAVAIPLLKKTGLGAVEKFFIALALGIMLPGLLFTLEGLAGIGFSLPLVFANILIITIAGIALAFKENALQFAMPEIFRKGESPFQVADRLWVPALLVLLVFLAFWIRFQSYTPIYQELDPYYYLYGTGQILKDGIIPLKDDTAWYPFAESSHRTSPVKMYMEAQWYSLYTAGGAFEKYLLSAVASIYPAVAAAFLAFAAYLLVSEEYGRKFGLIAAGIMAFLPITILKMAAGVSEVQPFGLFMLMMFFATYLMAVRRKTLELAVLAGMFYVGLMMGSSTGIVAMLVIPMFIVLYSLLLFAKGEKLDSFIRTNAVFFAFFMLASWLQVFYHSGAIIAGLFSFNAVLVAGPVAFAYVLSRVKDLKDNEMRSMAIGGILIILVFGFFFTPVGEKFKDYGRGAIGAAIYNVPLERTIAEQGMAGTSFEGELGFIGTKFGCDSSALSADDYRACMVGRYPQLQGAAQIPATDPDLVAGFFGIFSSIANFIIKWFFDTFLGMLLDFRLDTSTKENSLALFFFLAAILGAISGAVRMLFVKEESPKAHHSHEGKAGHVAEAALPAHDDKTKQLAGAALPAAFLLIALFAVPVSYVGFNKIKYTIFLGVAIALAAVFFFAELSKVVALLLSKYKASDEHKAYALSAILLLGFATVYLEAFAVSGWGGNIILNSVNTRFQDNPMALKQKFAGFCEQAGGSGSIVCSAAGDPVAFSSTMENQFNSQLCYLSLVSNLSKQTDSERIGMSYRCSRLAQYWLDSMDWINANTNENDRITSWWDYGHWTNYFGQRKTVLRNEHVSKEMIGEVAHAYIDGTPEELAASMKRFDSKYALFDGELIVSGSGLGGKYGALNYLSCSWDNQTNVSFWPGSSQCEFDHMFESIYVQKSEQKECVISDRQGISGIVAYGSERVVSPEGKVTIGLTPKYCIGTAKLVDGREVSPATYYLDRKTADGDLVLNKAFLQSQEQYSDMTVLAAYYTKDYVWAGANGTVSSGWEDRKGKFYDSNLYTGFFLKEIEGFTLVYETSGGEVKIYRMNS